MSSIVNTLLEELYTLEPDLRTKESSVKGLIEDMIAHEPHVEIDETFRKELRAKIMHEMAGSQKPSWNWWPMVSFACLCLIVGVWLRAENISSPTPIAFENTVQNVEKNAFGDITLTGPTPVVAPEVAQTGAAEVTTTKTTATAKTTKTVNNAGGKSAPQMARLGDADAISSKKMMAPDTMIYPPMDFPVYNYTYKGDIKLPETSLPVYKKTNVPFSANETNGILRNLSLGSVDVAAFENLGIANLTLTEDVEYGYMLNLDFTSGTISMYQNYQKWPQPVCDNTGCTTLPQLTEADIPSDETIIATADAFLAKYGIDKTIYGQPKVDSTWRIWYTRSAEMSGEKMIPEIYTITYPILMDGKPVYEEGGVYRGLTLNYDVRTKRISNMYGIEKTKLEKSDYDTIQDPALLEKMVKSGGRYINDEVPPQDRTVVDVPVGDPSLGYVHLFGEWKNGTSQEYFVPAYIFSVENPPKENFAQNTIIVPLVKEFTQTVGPMPVDPIIYSTEPVAEPMVKKQ